MIKTYMKPRKIKPRAIKVREYKVKPIVVRREAVDKDFLKYIKVVRAWARYKHGLSLEDFEMLCYLYSEHVFDANQFDQYCQIFGFTKNRRLDLMEKGLIVHFRKPEPGKRAIYELSHQAKAIMRQVYEMLQGEKPIPKLSDIKPKNNKPHHFAKRQYDRVIGRLNKDF
jgi:hypothetical protein